MFFHFYDETSVVHYVIFQVYSEDPVWLHRALSRAFVDDACCQHDICFYDNI